ncbi:phage tail length tape measure family protein [Bradyrhizobium sp. 174]|nr:phage tail length tape measure family protein [Bradyrhizobium sp. 174]
MAGVALSSLRVTTDGDSSGYVRAADAKVAADQRMIASDKSRNASLAQADAALQRAIPGVGSLGKTLLDGYGTGAQFEAIVRRIGSAVDRGMGLDRANLLLDATYRKFGLTADAAVLAERGFVSITGAVRELNAEYGQLSLAAASAAAAVQRTETQAGINAAYGIGAGPSKSAQESADAFLAQFGGLEGVARAKAQEAGAAFAQDLDQRMIAGAGKSARDAAAAFEAQFTLDNQKARQAGENFQRSLTEALGGGGPSATSQGATYSALAEQVARLDQIEQLRAGHNAQVTQQLVATAYGYDAVAKSAKDSAAFFLDVAQAEEQAAAKAAALRAQINPLEAEMVRLGKEMVSYRGLLDQGLISSSEFEQAQAMAAKRLSDVDMNMRNAATGGRVLSGELANLGYQVNDVLTGLALGQSPFMILAQQGGQVFQIFQNSKAGITDFFSVIGTKAMSYLTTSRVVWGGVAGVIGVSVAALQSYLSAQEKVSMGLLGSGRASGATRTGINQTAQAGSSATGLSVSEARELATALATTGRVANDNILPIVQMGKDISHIFGVDATEATKMLADAFSDPARGADQLNQRLGFLDAGMKRNIDNLVAQNKSYDAQKVLLAGVKSSLDGVSDAVSNSSKFWTVLGNAISNSWDGLGGFLASMTGFGRTLDQNIDQARAKLATLKNSSTDFSMGFALNTGGSAKEIAAAEAELDKMVATQQRLAQASAQAAAAQKSFLIESTARSLQSEIADREKLNNDLKVLHDILTSLGGDEAAGARLAQLGLSMKQLADATAVAAEKVKSFKSDYDTAVDAAKTANAAISAFSPSQKGDIARQQSLQANQRSNYDATQKQALADLASANAVKQVTVALSEAGRARELAGRQSIDGAKAEQDMVGKTMAQQETIRANLQARQQLEQEASVNRTAFDEAQYQRLVKINEQLGRQKQLAAEAALNDSIKFGSQTSLLSPEDAQIAQQLRFKYGDVQQSLVSVEAQGLRTNAALSGLSSTISGQLVTGMTDIVDGTKSIGQGFGDMSKLVIRAIEEMIVKIAIIQPMMQALQIGANSLGLGSGLSNLFGGGSAGLANTGMAGSAYYGPVAPSALGNIFAGGNIIPFARGGVVHGPTIFPMARGAGLMGEAGPEAVMPLRRGPDGRLGVSAGGAANDNRSTGGVIVNVINQTGVQAEASTSRNGNGDITVTLKKMMDESVGQSISSGSGARALKSQYGARQFMGS